jgi:hypothetical protein
MSAFHICGGKWQSYRAESQTRRHPENLSFNENVCSVQTNMTPLWKDETHTNTMAFSVLFHDLSEGNSVQVKKINGSMEVVLCPLQKGG